MQHRLVVAARAFMGDQARPRDFARRLGDDSSNGVVKIRRKLSGESPMSLYEVAHWSDAFHVDLSSVAGTHAGDPNAYPPLYRALIVDDEQQVRFRRRDELHWGAAAPRALQLILEDMGCSPTLVTNDVVRLRLHQALTFSGFDPSLIRVTQAGLTLLVNDPIAVHVEAAAFDDEDSWARVRRAVVAAPSPTVILVLGLTALARLKGLAPDVELTAIGGVFDLPAAAFEGAAASGELPHRRWEKQACEEDVGVSILVLGQKLT